MSGKYVNDSKKNIKHRIFPAVIILIAVLLVAAMATLLSSGMKTDPATVPSQTNAVVREEEVQIEQTTPVKTSLENSLEILDVGSYTGAYVEDGSDEVLPGILMLKVVNHGEDTIEYAKLTMDVGGETAEFSISTLKPGATMILLEKNRMQYDKSVEYSSAAVVCENLALFQEPLSLHEDKLQVQILDGAINVTNISGEDISGKISIYYKNTASGIYYGGITYRVTLDEGLKAGEIRQMMANHFSDTGSEIVFITIAQ